MTESRANRIKRLKMRSMRRGIKEMDLILSAFADVSLEGMDGITMDRYDALLEENDHDLYQWVSGQIPTPDPYGGMIAEISQVFQKQE